MQAFRWDGVRNECREVSDCRLHCHVGDSWSLYGELGAEIWAVAAGVEGRGEEVGWLIGISFAPPGLVPFLDSAPTACAVGFILSPLRGWMPGRDRD